jgi:hypothetical protein
MSGAVSLCSKPCRSSAINYEFGRPAAACRRSRKQLQAAHFRKAFVCCAATPETSQVGAPEKDRLNSIGGIVTDETVPEGHKGLHGFLYGDSGAGMSTSCSFLALLSFTFILVQSY